MDVQRAGEIRLIGKVFFQKGVVVGLLHTKKGLLVRPERQTQE